MCFNLSVDPSVPSTPVLDRLLARIADLEALVASQAQEIARLKAHIAAQDAELSRLRSRTGSGKNSRNSSIPPSQSLPENRKPAATPPKKKGPRRGHRGQSRQRAQPSLTVTCHPTACSACGADLRGVPGHVRNRSQQVELPPLSPTIVEVLCFRCFCPACGQANTAPYPEGWDPDQTFGPRLQMAIAYLHHHHHVGCERLRGLFADLWGLSISRGAVTNVLARVQQALQPQYEAIAQQVRDSTVVGSDETRQRVCGQNRWEWTVQSASAVYHWIAHRRNAKELHDFYGESLPEVQESDCYSAQLASPVTTKQVCHAHQLRDLLHAQEQGDTEYAPRMSRLIRMAIGLHHRRERLRPELFAHQAARLKRLGHQLGFGPLARNAFGEAQQQRYRRLEAWWWVFLERGDVSPTNNASERALRPSVIHRKVTGGFRSEWGASAYAGFLSVVQTLQREGVDLFENLLALLKPHDLACPVPASDA
jgi:transposase